MNWNLSLTAVLLFSFIYWLIRDRNISCCLPVIYSISKTSQNSFIVPQPYLCQSFLWAWITLLTLSHGVMRHSADLENSMPLIDIEKSNLVLSVTNIVHIDIVNMRNLTAGCFHTLLWMLWVAQPSWLYELKRSRCLALSPPLVTYFSLRFERLNLQHTAIFN